MPTLLTVLEWQAHKLALIRAAVGELAPDGQTGLVTAIQDALDECAALGEHLSATLAQPDTPTTTPPPPVAEKPGTPQPDIREDFQKGRPH